MPVPPKTAPADSFSVPLLASAPKGDAELGKMRSSDETIRAVNARFAVMETKGTPLLSNVRRVDSERLRIPVFLSQPGSEGQRLLPDERVLGAGASVEQAEASAMMSLAERYSYYSFWERLPSMGGVMRGTWSEAVATCGPKLIQIEELLASVGDTIFSARCTLAKKLFDLMPWTFVPTLQLGENKSVWVPAEWFRMINATNGCAAGNSMTEAILSGLCEATERHVSVRIMREHIECPTLSIDVVQDPVLKSMIAHYRREGVHILLKDFTLDMPLPTVGVLAADMASFPGTSEIVLTAATATSPEKAALKALTEAARLGGDFCTSSCYTPIGLPKYGNRHESQWLEAGKLLPLSQLPDISGPDMQAEVKAIVMGARKQGTQLYALDMTHPELRIPVQYTIAPGFTFLQREQRGGLGLYIGRRLAEEAPPAMARAGLDMLAELMPESTHISFFNGLLLLRAGQVRKASELFSTATGVQETPDSEGLCAYYSAYSRTLFEDWSGAVPWLDRAITLSPASSDAWSLRGICRFKLKEFAPAAENFKAALRRNKGSAPDLANLGACYMELGDYEQARACLVTALHLEPGLVPAKERLAALSQDEG